MPIIVVRPGGLMWDGVHYEYGARLPDEVRNHPSYPTLLAVNYIVERSSKKLEKAKKKKKKKKRTD